MDLIVRNQKADMETKGHGPDLGHNFKDCYNN